MRHAERPHRHRELRLYRTFNRRDIEDALAMMSEEVDWPNAWKGGRLVGRDAVRSYWSAQWAEIDPHVEPLSVTERADGSLAVAVRQVVRTPGGEILGDGEVVHVYRLEDGLIRCMDVEEPAGGEIPAAVMDLELVNFDRPSEVRTFEKGTFELYEVGPATLGRATYEPGWRWSEHVGTANGETACQVEHVGWC